ncbi:tRNA (N(6)-L-threonylcarbamoyladenosine(37)-C(2))-methylthiotransferase MtaB [Chloroflexota bacterium]
MSNEPVSVALDTVGCKLNQAETESFARQFADAGYRLVASPDEADIYILNTCTVTHVADRKSRHLLRRAHRQNPHALIVVTGCYAGRAHEEIARIAGVSLIAGNRHKSHLVKLVEKAGGLSNAGPFCDYPVPNQAGLRTRAFVKAQDGCNSFCAYCIVPLVRPGEESTPADRVVADIRDRVDRGYQEVVLTGTRIGSYRYEGVGLSELLRRILTETDIARLRLSSLQPREISAALIGLWRDERLCRHFHLSLQSGSDGVLVRMKRRYTLDEYRQAVSMIRDAIPEAAITTDIIVGFPGETDDEFEESYGFCRQMEFARIHVFSFSQRRGTEAARMPQPVADKVKKQRSERMLAQAKESARNFSHRFLGREMPVLWERRADGIWSGLTGNYIKVYTGNGEDLTNRLLPGKLLELRGDGVWGEVLYSAPSPDL